MMRYPAVLLCGGVAVWLLLLRAQGFKGEPSQMPALDKAYHAGNLVLLSVFVFAVVMLLAALMAGGR